LLSVALSLASRPVGVTHHRALWSPDFPPARSAPPGGGTRTRAGDHPVHSSPSSLMVAAAETIVSVFPGGRRRGEPSAPGGRMSHWPGVRESVRMVLLQGWSGLGPVALTAASDVCRLQDP